MAIENISKHFAKWADVHAQRILTRLFNSVLTDITVLRDRLKTQTLVSGALAITGGGSATAKIGSTAQAICNGVLVTKTTTNMPALAGTILQNNFGGWAFYIDSGGNLTSVFLNQGATLAAVTFPAVTAGLACLGYVTLNPTTATFIGGTTLLDAANTNAVYTNTVGAFEPSAVQQLAA
jgi:hypothetical protein